MFMMCGQERRLMWQGLAEAALNILFSVSLTLLLVHRNWQVDAVIGVAAGSVLPTILFGWGLLWRWAAREVNTSPLDLFTGIAAIAGIWSIALLPAEKSKVLSRLPARLRPSAP
jgi:hypothetical protein